MVAELLVVVVAQAGLQLVRAEAALVFDKYASVVAFVHQEVGGTGHFVPLPIAACGQQLSVGEGEIGLQRSRVALRVEGVDVAANVRDAEVRVGFVGCASGLRGELEAFARRPGQLAAEHALGGFGLIAAEVAAVVFVVGIGIEEVAFHRHVTGDLDAAAQRQGHIAIAIPVGFVGEATLEDGKTRSSAGVDAVGFLVRAFGTDPAPVAAIAEAGAGLAQIVAARADAEMWFETDAAVTGENLDHAADGFRPIEA